MLSPLEFAAATLIMAVGSAFQAAVGLGLALLVVPFLALIDTRFIPGPMLFAGIALTALYSPNGWVGHYLAQLGLKVAYTPAGVVVADKPPLQSSRA